MEHEAVLKKLQLLKARGILNCKLPDIFLGSLMARISYDTSGRTCFQLGELVMDAIGGMYHAEWFLVYDDQGGLMVSQKYDDDHIIKMLDKYNAILDDLMVIADNGLLT